MDPSPTEVTTLGLPLCWDAGWEMAVQAWFPLPPPEWTVYYSRKTTPVMAH